MGVHCYRFATTIALAALVLLTIACSDDETTGGGGAAGSGNTGAGAGHSEAGVGECACPPGTVDEGEEGCVAAGFRECGAGFIANDEGGCDPVLPATPCGAGQRATLGSESCAPVACSDADIPTDGTSTMYVDASHTGGSDGSEQAPFPTTMLIGRVPPERPSRKVHEVAPPRIT